MNMTHSFKAKPLLISAATVLTFTLFYISSRLFGPAFQLFDSEYTFLDRLTEEAKLTSLYPSHQAKTHFEGIWGGGLAAIFNTTLGVSCLRFRQQHPLTRHSSRQSISYRCPREPTNEMLSLLQPHLADSTTMSPMGSLVLRSLRRQNRTR